jgi:Cys-tRNA synthase (O-phospho-L-seryl-tRNA:Cys-tRNA synthase)
MVVRVCVPVGTVNVNASLADGDVAIISSHKHVAALPPIRITEDDEEPENAISSTQ